MIPSKPSSPVAFSILIANRGEIAVRIARAAAELSIRSVAVYSTDDERSLHRKAADADHPLRGAGPRAYLDIDALIDAATSTGCTAIHPGYGFLSENAEFARRCEAAGLLFIGASPRVLELFGDKGRARELARSLDVPVPDGTDRATSLDEARAFMARLGDGASMMVKAIAGGGGRGMRVVDTPAALEPAYERCRSEARSAFGRDDVYVEEVISPARHVEVQIAGDGRDVVALGERDCSVQRRHQKVVEIAPCPGLPEPLRERLFAAATRMAREVSYRGVGTFEFLVGLDGERFVFIEANPRIQVEHTVTEEVMGIDLVRAQIALARGATLADAGLDAGDPPRPRGFAIQLRVTLDAAASVAAGQAGHAVGGPADAGAGADGRLTAWDLPSGPGVRVDTAAYLGYAPNPNFDPLLAKIIAHVPSKRFGDLMDRAARALSECRIEGVATNIPFLRALLASEAFRDGVVTTRFVDENPALSRPDPAAAAPRSRHFDPPPIDTQASADGDGATLDGLDDVPDESPDQSLDGDPDGAPDGEGPAANADCAIAPLRGTIVQLPVAPGAQVRASQAVAILEAMKMEHEVAAPYDGVVVEILRQTGTLVPPGAPIVRIEPGQGSGDADAADDQREASSVRADLLEVQQRYARTLDAARPDAVARRRKTGQRTARENLDDVCDPGSFAEYGALAVAGQRNRHTYDELLKISPADGFIYGTATVNADRFPPDRSRCMVAAYDYTVFAGTQGFIGHKKHDRMFQLAERARLPVVIFTEGGGGRPYDGDNIGGVNLANPTFWHFARLSGLVPLIGIGAGRCFAGNAALLGCCDVVIATRSATIGMGGPVMIEGAGLGVVKPEDVGPARMHSRQGVVDILVDDEREAAHMARKYLSYFQGPLADWRCADQSALRHVIPERRTRSYEVRQVIGLLADEDSVLELRPSFGTGVVTALIRIEGRPIGLIANNPRHQAGALGSDESDKVCRFLQLCDAFDLPMVSLCDTPGIMVGTDAERTALVRHASRIFVTAANVTVPFFTVVLRKAYGLGAMAMGGGSFHQGSFFTTAWPTGEFGSMGLEGQIKLGHRDELAKIADPREREQRFQQLVDALYERGKALNVAPFLSFDAVIDPAETRRWILRGLDSFPPPAPRQTKKRSNVDTW
ncbi:MAG: carboxyl transferase domain-containing protein [Burkholderiaceae bacterium]